MTRTVAKTSQSPGYGLAKINRSRPKKYFVPLAAEHYELVIPAEHFDSPKLQALLAVVRSPAFRAAAEARGGYGLARVGEVVWER